MMGITMEEEIRRYGRELGADVVGFASVESYRSPKSPELKSILPGALHGVSVQLLSV